MMRSIHNMDVGPMLVKTYARSNVGLKRKNNEDNFYLSGVTVDSSFDIISSSGPDNKIAAAVFDGMGGQDAGEVASQISALTFGENVGIMENSDFSHEIIESVISKANENVCIESRAIGKNMGSTWVSFGYADGFFHIANIGDSRAYLLRNGQLSCLSKDHTVAQTMIDCGLVSYEQAQRSKDKHKLTQNIGIPQDEMLIEPFFCDFKALENDIILLCSDGLTDMLDDSQIEMILSKENAIEEKVNELISFALSKGGTDNVTVLVAAVASEKTYEQKNLSCIKKWMLVVLAVVLLVLAIIGFIANGKKVHKPTDEGSAIHLITDKETIKCHVM